MLKGNAGNKSGEPAMQGDKSLAINLYPVLQNHNFILLFVEEDRYKVWIRTVSSLTFKVADKELPGQAVRIIQSPSNPDAIPEIAGIR